MINPEGIRLRPRDFQLLEGLFESRIMLSRHVCAQYFDGKQEMTKKRLQKLKAAGLISAKRSKIYEPAHLQLTPLGFRLLHQEGLLCDYPSISETKFKRRVEISDLTLKHELAVMDAKAAIVEAIRDADHLSVDEFSTWPALFEFRVSERGKRTPTLLKPDGFIRIHETESDGSKSEHALFLEVDRGTEKLETLLHKAVCYNLYYRSGGFAERHGASKSQFKEYPFRVLMLLKSAKRIENFRRILQQNTPPIKSQIILCEDIGEQIRILLNSQKE